MDDVTDKPIDPADGATATEEQPTPEQLAAEQACDDLLRRIEDAAHRALDAGGDHAADDSVLAALVREYAHCARAAGMRPEHMVKPLKVAMREFFYDRRAHADELFRLAILGYFDIAP